MEIKTKFNINDKIIYLSENPDNKGEIIPLSGIINKIFINNIDNVIKINYVVKPDNQKNIFNIDENYIDNNLYDLLSRIPINCSSNIRYNIKENNNFIVLNDNNEEELPF
jgi:hypothetical protein